MRSDRSSFPIPYNLLAWKYHSKPLLQLQWTSNILPTKGVLRPGSPFLSSYSKHRYEGACGVDIILEHESEHEGEACIPKYAKDEWKALGSRILPG